MPICNLEHKGSSHCCKLGPWLLMGCPPCSSKYTKYKRFPLFQIATLTFPVPLKKCSFCSKLWPWIFMEHPPTSKHTINWPTNDDLHNLPSPFEGAPLEFEHTEGKRLMLLKMKCHSVQAKILKQFSLFDCLGIFSCPDRVCGQLNRWHCHSLTHFLILEHMTCHWMSESYQGDFLWQFWFFFKLFTLATIVLISFFYFHSKTVFFFNFSVFFCACIHNVVTREKILGKANNYCRIADRMYVPCKKMIGESQYKWNDCIYTLFRQYPLLYRYEVEEENIHK